MKDGHHGSWGCGRRVALARLACLPVASAAILGGTFSGCLQSPTPLRVGTNVWPGYEPLFLARQLGLFPRDRVQVLELPSATEVIAAYRNRAIDVAAVTADEALHLEETMPGQRILLVCDVSLGADVILAKPPVADMKGLRGRRVAVESGALGAYVLSRALELAGMTPTEVVPVALPIHEHEGAYVEGLVDAAVTFEPVRSRLLAQGARIVFDSSRIPGEILDVLLTREDVVKENARELTALMRGWFQALDRLNADPEGTAAMAAERERITPEAFLAARRLLEIPDLARNRQLLSPGPEGLEGPLRRLAATLLEHRLLSRPVPVEGMLEGRFLQEVRP